MSGDLFSHYFLCNFTEHFELNDLPKNCVDLWSCNWLEILQSEFVRDFVKNDFQLSRNIDDEIILKTAVAFLFAFLQENFTGPKLNEKYEKFSEEVFLQEKRDPKCLSVDSEEVNINVRYAEYLITSEALLNILLKKYPDSTILNWWMMRSICTHQKIIDQLTNSNYIKFKEISEKLIENLKSLEENNELLILLSVEIAQGYLIFHRTAKYEEIFENICNKFKIELLVEGLMGYRTKFQQKPLPQLCLRVKINENDSYLPATATHGKTTLPKLLKHEDEVRLEKIKFCDEKDNEVIALPSVLQTLVLSKLKYVLRSQPKDRLAAEEIEPYLTTLIYQEFGPVTIRLAALFINIAQESNHKRTVERCLKQSEEISKIISGERFTTFERFSYAFASELPPHWEFKKQLGDLLVSLGYVKTALDIYLEIQSFENVVECYNHLELHHLAAETIQNQLFIKPTVSLYCLLGDATNNVECYETAWNFSDKTSSQAQRHWGNYYFAKKNYELALPHLEKTVEINSLQEVQWLRLGYAAISLEKWELAVHAYLTYTHLEPHGFESWNNLAKALIKLGDKTRAHKILNESLKCNFNNWKVWENFMLVSIDTGNFEDSLNAYNRLIELKEKEKFLDIEVLEIVVKAIAQDLPDSQGRLSGRLKKKASKILGQQCIQYPNEWKLFKLASSIAETHVDSAVKLQKCYRAYVQKYPNWTQIVENTIECLNICLEMSKTSLEAHEKKTDSDKLQVNSQISSARLAAQACIRSVKTNASEQFDGVSDLVVELENYFEKFTNIMKQSL